MNDLITLRIPKKINLIEISKKYSENFFDLPFSLQLFSLIQYSPYYDCPLLVCDPGWQFLMKVQ